MLWHHSNTLAGHSAAIYSIGYGTKSGSIISAGGDRYVAQWNVESAQQEALAIKLEHPVYAALVLKENLLAVGTSIGSLHIIDLVQKKEIHHLAVHSNGIYDFHYNHQSKQLIALGGDGVLSVWSVLDFALLYKIQLAKGKLRQIAVSDESALMAVACGDGTVRIIEPAFFNEIKIIQAHEQGATAVAWHPSKPILMTGGKDAMLKCWNVNNQYENLLSLPAHNYAIYSIAFNNTGQFMATCSRDKTIKIWDANTLDNLQKMNAKHGGHSHSVNKVLWMDDTLLSCGDDRKIIIWTR